MHRTTARFWALFSRRPEAVQEVARKNFDLLQANPDHPFLHFKKVGKLWSVRVGLNHRAPALEESGEFLWVWIGSHDDYRRLIKQQG